MLMTTTSTENADAIILEPSVNIVDDDEASLDLNEVHDPHPLKTKKSKKSLKSRVKNVTKAIPFQLDWNRIGGSSTSQLRTKKGRRIGPDESIAHYGSMSSIDFNSSFSLDDAQAIKDGLPQIGWSRIGGRKEAQGSTHTKMTASENNSFNGSISLGDSIALNESFALEDVQNDDEEFQDAVQDLNEIDSVSPACDDQTVETNEQAAETYGQASDSDKEATERKEEAAETDKEVSETDINPPKRSLIKRVKKATHIKHVQVAARGLHKSISWSQLSKRNLVIDEDVDNYQFDFDDSEYNERDFEAEEFEPIVRPSRGGRKGRNKGKKSKDNLKKKELLEMLCQELEMEY